MSPDDNKKVAHLYHELNPDDIDTILTSEFIGHRARGNNWSRDDHRRIWLEHHTNVKDTIHEMLADGDWVSIRFSRTHKVDDKPVTRQFMQMMRFVNGQIAELWEVYED